METIQSQEILWSIQYAGLSVQFVVAKDGPDFLAGVLLNDEFVKVDSLHGFETVGIYAAAILTQLLRLGFEGIPCDADGNSRHDPCGPVRPMPPRYLVH